MFPLSTDYFIWLFPTKSASPCFRDLSVTRLLGYGHDVLVDEPSMRWRSVERMARLLNVRCLSRLGLLSPCGILTSLFSLSILVKGVVRLLGSISNSLSCSITITG